MLAPKLRVRDLLSLLVPLSLLLGLPARPTPDTEFDAFPAYLWRAEHLGRPLPGALLDLVGGTEIPRAEPADWVLEADRRFYLRHAPGRDALHLDREASEQQALQRSWLETRDPRRLVRSPCLSDPQTARSLKEQLDRSLAPPDRAAADFIALGDEVSVTPWGDPLDLCRSAHCDAAWQRWLEHHGSRYGLDAESPRPSTDALLAHPSPGRLAAWLAARAFQRDVLSGLLEDLARHARQRQPEVPLALLGLIGETAFGGVDLERLPRFLEVVEPYAVADARERLATLRALEGQPERILATVFLDRDPTVDELRAELARFEPSPVNGVVVWSDRELAADAERQQALAEGLRALRRADRAQDRDPRGVAWLASDDSLAHAWLRDARADGAHWWKRLAGFQERHGTYEGRRQAWFEAARGRGESPGSIDVGRVDEALLPRFERLVAIGLTVISDAELASLERYVEAGGSVWVERPFATLRPDGSRRDPALLPAWAE